MPDSREISITVSLASENKNPEQISRDAIDKRLRASGWAVQSIRELDHDAAAGVAVKEYTTSVGPADYVLFSNRKPLGVVEAKPDSWSAKITTVEEQSSGYAAAQLNGSRNPNRSISFTKRPVFSPALPTRAIRSRGHARFSASIDPRRYAPGRRCPSPSALPCKISRC